MGKACMQPLFIEPDIRYIVTTHAPQLAPDRPPPPLEAERRSGWRAAARGPPANSSPTSMSTAWGVAGGDACAYAP